MAQRYEYKEGSSSKFWEIDLKGSSFTTKHGKIGTTGQTLLKDWPDAATAKKEHDKLVAQKVKKGYELVAGGAKSTKAVAKPVAAKSVAAKKVATPIKGTAAAATAGDLGSAYNASLAKMIDADPDDAGAWAVYADWLQSQGDLRGELGVVQESLRASPKDKALLSAEKKLLKEHAATLIGDYAMYMCRAGKTEIGGVLTKPDLEPDYRHDSSGVAPVRALWRSGFLSQVFVGHPDYDWSPPSKKKKPADDDGDGDGDGDGGGEVSVDVPKLVTDILSSPAARFLTSLRLGMANTDGECVYRALVAKLAKHEALGRLRSLYIGDIAQEECECSWVELGDLSKLWPSLKQLRSLTIRGGSNLKLGKIDLPQLRELTIITGGLDKKTVAAILAAKWPKLEKLELWFGTSNYGGNTTAKDYAAIMSSKAFPKLKHLGLRNAEHADVIAKAIPGSPLLKQLEALDLSKGILTEAGVQTLVDGKDSFAHLRKLDLSDNYIGKSAQLASTITKVVRTKPQRAADVYDDETYRYVALGE